MCRFVCDEADRAGRLEAPQLSHLMVLMAGNAMVWLVWRCLLLQCVQRYIRSCGEGLPSFTDRAISGIEWAKLVIEVHVDTGVNLFRLVRH